MKRPTRTLTRLERQLVLLLIGWMCFLAIAVLIVNQNFAGNVAISAVLVAGSAALAATFLKRDWRLWLVSVIFPIVSIVGFPFAGANVADIIALESLLIALVALGLYQAYFTRKGGP